MELLKIENRKGVLGIIVVIIAILIIGGFIFYASMSRGNSETESKSSTAGNTMKVNGEGNSPVSAEEQNTGNPREYTIEIISSGFLPNNLEIKAGDSVTWMNKDTAEHWPASAMHPTHTVYTGGKYEESGSYMGSQACRSEGVAKTGAFDSCRGLSQGESWTFTFDEKGSWNYHDHLVSGRFGKIVVN